MGLPLRTLAATSEAVASTASRLRKIEQLAALLSSSSPDEVEVLIAFLSGGPRQGRIGIGQAAIRLALAVPPAASSSLTLAEVDEAFGRISQVSGARSSSLRAELLRSLMGRATGEEQQFLARLLFGELRQGALEGVLIEAVARAANIPAPAIRRATMLSGDLAPVARAALTEGRAGVDRYAVRIFQPVQPMLADSASDLTEAIARTGASSIEWKLDGARIQVHKDGDDVRVYSRALRDVSPAVPEVIEIVRALPARSVILDGEAIALQPDGTPYPFQVTMRRFGRRKDQEALRRELPLTPMFFDVLYAEGTPALDEPLARRLDLLEAVARAHAVPHLRAPDAPDADAFVRQALAQGHEGVMVKSLEAPYAAGRRGSAWMKVKQARTLDLVVIAVEWGSGRRKGWLSNLHLGARDPEHNSFVMLGKTFKGLTDRMLEWQTGRFLQLEIARDGHTVYLKPEVVVEIGFNDIQVSPHYPGGVALRFARVKRYRDDKSAVEADTIETVRRIYRELTGADPPAPRWVGR